MAPERLMTPPDSAALKPWNDSPVGVYEVPSTLTLRGARVHEMTSESISILGATDSNDWPTQLDDSLSGGGVRVFGWQFYVSSAAG